MKTKISSARTIKGNNQYTNEWIEWDDLRERFREPKRTYETMEEYQNKLAKLEQTSVKNAAGAFVGGWLEVDKEQASVDRKLENVLARNFLNFDFDNIDSAEQLEQLQENLYDSNNEFILYSTHSHTPNKPRVRVLLPLDREVNIKEFEAISRYVAGSNEQWARMVDTKSFKPAQAMFYATAAKDGEYVFDYSAGELLVADEVLEAHKKDYPEAYKGGKWWEYPKVPSEQKSPVNPRISTNTDTQDPTKKPSYIGAFNRAYNIHEAITKFIPEKYTYEGNNRYTWNEGTTAGGAVVYDDFNEGDFLYSNHETDPAGNQLLNAFDLVRIHLYGYLDDNTRDDIAIQNRASYELMIRIAKDNIRGLKEIETDKHDVKKVPEKKPASAVAAERAISKLDFEKDTFSSLDKINATYREYLTEEQERQLYFNSNAAANMNEFTEELGEYKDPIKTGFPIFDRVLDGGLHDGLYIVGAISSLGKTTLVLQMADQIAKTGQDVLFFSLEMSAKEIKAKSISRLTFENVQQDGKPEHNAKTVRGITDRRSRQAGYTDIWNEEHPPYSQYEEQIINKSIKQYANEAKNLFIIEGIGSIGVETVKKTVENHIKYTGNRPVVIIDYLQILAPADERADDKRNTDKAVLELKRLSRDHLIPVFAISSLNRANYTSAINMSAFKESGAIEYSSDVLIGLQFSKQRKADEQNKTRRPNAPVTVLDHDSEKSREPRQIELKILKNRNGMTGISVDYDYHAKYNSFKEKELVNMKKQTTEGALFEKNNFSTV